jgi:outer membrane immunogenic protein
VASCGGKVAAFAALFAFLVGFDGVAGAQERAPNWTGAYVGVNGGYAWSGLDAGFDNFTLIALGKGFSQDNDGYKVGGHAGYQQQFGALVVGFEVTYDAANLDGTSKGAFSNSLGACPFACVFTQGSEQFDTRVTNLVTLTGRLGYTFDSVMGYVKGGYATANVDVKGNLPGSNGACLFFACASLPYSITGESEKRHDGWTLGAGTEYMIARHVMLGVEYNYTDLGSRTHSGNATVTGFGPAFPTPYSISVDPD